MGGSVLSGAVKSLIFFEKTKEKKLQILLLETLFLHINQIHIFFLCQSPKT